MNEELLKFLENSPTCFHAIANIRAILEGNGYHELNEAARWTLEEGGKYYTTRNGSSLIAFQIPTKLYEGFMIGASHCDSPAFKVKENPELVSGGYTRLNVEGYGGMLCAPWFDRPLSLAGRIVARNGDTMETRLVNFDRDLLMIPSLAIHMDRTANKGHEYNAQKELCPILGEESEKGILLKMLAEETGVPEEDILGQDLFLYARVKGSVWGRNGEFLSAGHLDDLQCTYGDLKGFLASSASKSVPVLAVFDNEEVGSMTKQGAFSTFLQDVLERISIACGRSEEERRAFPASSFMVSADNAHAIHPNYTEKADPVNRPLMNKGIVIKYSANQKYTTDAVSAAIFKQICTKANVPYQIFTNRSDMVGGSTLGNLSNVHVSLNTVDIGLAQLAMHSPYETAGTKDTQYLADAMKVFFSSSIQAKGSSYTVQ